MASSTATKTKTGPAPAEQHVRAGEKQHVEQQSQPEQKTQIGPEPGAGSSDQPVQAGVVLAEHLAGSDCAPVTRSPGVAGLAGGAAKFSDQGGKVLQVVQVQLVYWGSAWTATTPAPTPTSAAVTDAVRRILAGPYLTGLNEYRGIGRGFLRGASVITTSNPPANFTDAQVWNFVNGQITAGALPEPDVDGQTLYVVVMPQGVNASNSGFIGEHTFNSRNGVRVPFAWITNNGALDSVTRIISHEIVESCTDPEGSAILGVAGTCSQSGWCEIGDVCSSTQVRDGVSVQSFWSDAAGACVVPDWPARTYPRAGVQFTGSLAANQTRRWFTFRWPEWERVEWWMLPTTVRPGGPQLRWDVALERASGNFLTYWLTVTNLTPVPLTFEGRYTVLGRS